MSRLPALVGAALALGVGCGDSSTTCGPGTHEDSGECVADLGPTCGDGTVLDPSGTTCVPADGVCANADEVVVSGHCVPEGDVAIDLEEGAEPNGLDPGATPAGTIELRPIGDPHGFVVHGCVKPVTDIADLDDFKLTVAGPTLVEVTADGVKGLDAGFVALGPVGDADVGTWERYGLNLETDLSKRQLYFPKAGTYDLVLTDSRSILPFVDGGGTDVLPPAGNPDGTSCYFVTLNQLAPAYTALDLGGANTGELTGGEVKFFRAPAGSLPLGFVRATATLTSSHAAPSVLAIVGDELRARRDVPAGSPATAFFGGIDATDTVIVLDHVWDYAVLPVPYRVALDLQMDAQALPTDGSTITATSKGQQFGQQYGRINLFYFDAPTDDYLADLRVAFSEPVQGVIAYQGGNGAVYAQLTGLDGTPAFPSTFTSYEGALRLPLAGRYYFFVYLPRTPVGTSFTVAGTLAPIAAAQITLGAPLTAQPVGPFGSRVYSFDATTEPWERFDATGSNTGDLVVALYDEATASGRLDPLLVTSGTGAGLSSWVAGDPVPQLAPPFGTCPLADPGCTFRFPPGGAPVGRVLAGQAISAYLVRVRPVAPSSGAVFGLDFAKRVYTDLGTLASGSSTLHAGDASAPGDAHRYFLRTAPGNQIRITAHPALATDDPVIARLSALEQPLGATTAPAGADDVLELTQDASGFTAFQVSGALAQTYDLTVEVVTPFYTVHDTSATTTFADACAGGSHIAIGDGDEALTAGIPLPAGFTFYGAAVSSVRASSNGFLTFDASTTDAQYTPRPLPDALGETNIAPFWQDLEHVDLCAKSDGTRLILQWTGDQYADGLVVQFQAILDGADGSIEFVFGPAQESTGVASFPGATQPAISGVQDTAGAQATAVSNGGALGFTGPGAAFELTH